MSPEHTYPHMHMLQPFAFKISLVFAGILNNQNWAWPAHGMTSHHTFVDGVFYNFSSKGQYIAHTNFKWNWLYQFKTGKIQGSCSTGVRLLITITLIFVMQLQWLSMHSSKTLSKAMIIYIIPTGRVFTLFHRRSHLNKWGLINSVGGYQCHSLIPEICSTKKGATIAIQ